MRCLYCLSTYDMAYISERTRRVLEILDTVLNDIRGIASFDPIYVGGPLRITSIDRLEAVRRLANITGILSAAILDPDHLTEFALLQIADAIEKAVSIWADRARYEAMARALVGLADEMAGGSSMFSERHCCLPAARSLQ